MMRFHLQVFKDRQVQLIKVIIKVKVITITIIIIKVILIIIIKLVKVKLKVFQSMHQGHQTQITWLK